MSVLWPIFLCRGAQGFNIPQAQGGEMFRIAFGHRFLGRNMRTVIVQQYCVHCMAVQRSPYTMYTLSALHLCWPAIVARPQHPLWGRRGGRSSLGSSNCPLTDQRIPWLLLNTWPIYGPFPGESGRVHVETHSLGWQCPNVFRRTVDSIKHILG